MKKIKDIFWLLFWGIIGGAFFVGCILGFGYLVNNAGKLFHFRSGVFSSIAGPLVLSLLAGVIFGATHIISKVWNRFSKGYWEQAPLLFSKEEMDAISRHPLTAAILNKNDWELMGCMGLQKTRITARDKDRGKKLANEVIVNGKTALHIAAILGAKSACESLLYFWADPFCKDKYGRTPLDYAVEHHHEEVIKLLEKATRKTKRKK